MKTIIFFLIIFFAAGCVVNKREDQHTLAQDNSGQDTMKLENRIIELDGLSENMKKFIYHLSLLKVDSLSNVHDFVKYFPEDYENIMGVVYERIELNKLSPSFLYYFEVLGNYAVVNQNDAIRKLFVVYCHSDGVVADLLSDYIVKILQENTLVAASVLNTLDRNDSQRILSCLQELPEDDAKNIKNRIESYNLKK